MIMPHGTYSRYQDGCTCKWCRQANAEYHREYRRRIRPQLSPTDPKHGSRSTYLNYACRCPECTAAASAYIREYRQRKATA